MRAPVTPFELSGVVHLVRAAGHAARDLDSFRAALAAVPEDSLFYHTRQCLLRHATHEDLPPDDLSAWVHGVLQDRETAERLAFAAQLSDRPPAGLRQALLDVLDALPARHRAGHDAPEEGAFVFLTADSVRVPTGLEALSPGELMTGLAEADDSVWFYHLHEEPWHTGGPCPLERWLADHGAERQARVFAEARAAALSLAGLRTRALRRWRSTALGRRVAAAAGLPPQERAEAGRDAVAGLLRRLRRPEGA